MSAARRKRMDPMERADRNLQALHDGELGVLARRRLERRLARSPKLRRELETLRLVGDLVREREARAPEPDLWDRIALRLPAEEARRAEAAAQEPGRARGLAALLIKPLGAVAAAALAALALVQVLPSREPTGGVVRWMDSRGHSVLVLEDQSEVTVIWLLDTLPGAGPGSSKDASRDAPQGGAGGMA